MVTMGPATWLGKSVATTTKARDFETDGSGSFAIPAVDASSVRHGGLEVDFEIQDGPDVVVRVGSVTVDALSGLGETYLGDVTVVPPEVLAAGVVVDELGRPLAGAIVRAEPKQMAARPDMPQGAPMRGRHLGAIPMRTRSDASGAFALTLPVVARRSPTRIAILDVKAELEGYAQVARAGPFEPGRRDLTVVLDGVGAIEGSLQLHEGLPVRKIEMIVSRPPSEPQRFRDCVDSDGGFRLPRIRPGSVTLAITRAGRDTPFITIEDIAVPRLGVASDSRLRSIGF
jgi:hypothetical protein